MMKTLEGITPYPPEFIARYREAGYWEDQSIADFFADLCHQYAKRVALVAGNERITYGELDARAERLALHLLNLGLRPGDRFVLQLPNVPEFVYFYLALQKAGIMPVMALPPHRYTEISHFVKLSEAVGYALPERLGNFEFAAMAERIRSENAHLHWEFVLGNTIFPESISIRELLQTESGLPKEQLAHIEIDPLLPALFLLSGGTTGVPKLIPRTHNDYIYNSKAAAAINNIRPDDALLLVLPMAHNFPLACPGLQGFLIYGARCVLSTSTQAQDVFSLIEREKITHLELVPTLLIRLLNDPLLKEYNLSSVRIVNTGGQKLQPEVKRRTEELIPSCKVQEVFGMAEGLLNYVRLDDPDELRYETVGRPVSPGDELRLIDDEGNEVPDGEIGELLVRGPYTLRGYFRAPEHNAQVFTPDGYYKTGDLLRRHPSGNYIVEGRKKDLINRGGEKISAEEIENLMLSHPAILNAACVPMPDPTLGERVCAFVILRSSLTVTLEELTSFLLAKGIAKFKLPERLEVVDDFPMSKFGKVAKNVLTQNITEKITKAQV
jgi:2,3-dihydroxybenzoate-AMP ligase